MILYFTVTIRYLHKW